MSIEAIIVESNVINIIEIVDSSRVIHVQTPSSVSIIEVGSNRQGAPGPAGLGLVMVGPTLVPATSSLVVHTAPANAFRVTGDWMYRSTATNDSAGQRSTMTRGSGSIVETSIHDLQGNLGVLNVIAQGVIVAGLIEITIVNNSLSDVNVTAAIIAV